MDSGRAESSEEQPIRPHPRPVPEQELFDDASVAAAGAAPLLEPPRPETPRFDTFLSRADGATRARLLLQTQHTLGNHYVQRLLQRQRANQPATVPPDEAADGKIESMAPSGASNPAASSSSGAPFPPIRQAFRPAGPLVIQRSPLSDELAAASQSKTPKEIFALLREKKFKDGAQDPAELSALNAVLDKLLADPNDRWVAQKILAGALGMSPGIAAKGQPRLSKDIPPQPIEVNFFPGASDERALVVAGVHGSERQGIEVARILIDDVLKKAQPHYTVIVVPSLFPEHAHKNWGDEGMRERSTFTNRNFPDPAEEVKEYKGGQALDAAGNPIKAARDEKGRVQDILPENVMLMELIDRFKPTRIISIHGTWDPSAAGIFADPQFLSPAKEKAIDSLATTVSNLFGAMAGVPGFLIRDAEKQLLTEHFQKIDEAQTQNDIDLALASAYAVAKQTAGATELKGRLPDKGKQKFPAVAGNELQAGTGKENATWKVDMDPKTRRPKPWQERAKKGVSLGIYGPAKGISVFTVEPPVNRALDFYDGKTKEPKESGAALISKAQRETELKAYAEAVATILLGPDRGAAALSKQRAP